MRRSAFAHLSLWLTECRLPLGPGCPSGIGRGMSISEIHRRGKREIQSVGDVLQRGRAAPLECFGPTTVPLEPSKRLRGRMNGFGHMRADSTGHSGKAYLAEPSRLLPEALPTWQPAPPRMCREEGGVTWRCVLAGNAGRRKHLNRPVMRSNSTRLQAMQAAIPLIVVRPKRIAKRSPAGVAVAARGRNTVFGHSGEMPLFS
jgi:hypothetical protein